MEKDNKIVEKMNRHAGIRHARELRVSKIIKYPWEVPNNPQVDAELKKFTRDKEFLRWMCDAIFEGKSIIEIDWDKYRFYQIDHTRAKRVQGEDGGWYWGLQGINPDMAVKALDENFIVHTFDDREYKLGFGNGLNESLYYLYYMYTELLVYALQYFRGYGMPIMAYYYDPDVIEDHDNLANTITSRLNKITKRSGNTALGCHINDKMELLSNSGHGQDFIEFLGYLDDEIMKLVLGSSMASDVPQDRGTYGAAKALAPNLDTITDMDRELMRETLESQWAYGCWLKLGKPGEKPKFQFTIPKKPMTVDEWTVNQGRIETTLGIEPAIEVDEDEMREALGWSKPEPGKGVVFTRSQQVDAFTEGFQFDSPSEKKKPEVTEEK